MVVKELVKEIWSSGVVDADDIDRLWDPSDRQEGIDETFEEYWQENEEKITKALGSLQAV